MGEEADFESLAIRIVKNIEKNVKGVALEIHANLTEDTPVDTGWARSNWVAKLGRPSTTTVGSPGSVNPDSSTQALLEISKFQSGKGPINITNNVPYIGRLNKGSSKQAPSGFVEKAVQRAIKKIGGFR